MVQQIPGDLVELIDLLRLKRKAVWYRMESSELDSKFRHGAKRTRGWIPLTHTMGN